jgi:geranylgeranyl reductase family protein
MKLSIAIIGAGPVGSYAAYQLSKEGFEVNLFDTKKASQIGSPIQCTGLLTSEIKKFIPLKKDFLINTFSNIRVFSPDQQAITINKTEYLVDRTKFDQYILNLALKQGVVFHHQHKLTEIKEGKGKRELTFKHKKQTRKFSPDIIIGADGPLSLVSRYLNPFKKKTCYYGLQAVIKGSFNTDSYRVFLGSQVCPGLFAWLVPESKTKAKVGLAALSNPFHQFNNLLKTLDIKQKQIIEKQAGLIPLFDSKVKTRHKNVFLLGDAASHVKATTLGGIVPGFKAAINLTHHLTKKKTPFKNHQNLKLHLFIRKTLNKFSDKDYDQLVYLLSKPKTKKLLETHSRENPKKLIKKLFLIEPRLLFFVKHLFQN